VTYYNDHDPFCAEWAQSLVAAGEVPDGVMDSRPIQEVQPDELRGFTQCHFFSGILGWPTALRLAGWPDDRPVWTGSCPCQPFSSAGKRKGLDDERHLWPEFFRLVRACRPPVIFGEQVASSEVIGTQLEADFLVAVQTGEFARANKLAKRLVAKPDFTYSPRWFDGICADLEAAHYTIRAIDLPAASVEAPHARQRLFWVADAGSIDGVELSGRAIQRRRTADAEQAGVGRGSVGLADAESGGFGITGSPPGEPGYAAECHETVGLGNSDGQRDSAVGSIPGGAGIERDGSPSGLGNASCSGLRSSRGAETEVAVESDNWSLFRIVHCRDGKIRRISAQSGDEPLAFRIPVKLGPGLAGLRGVAKDARRNRVGRLRGYGNAIVPAVAAKFIRAYMKEREANG